MTNADLKHMRALMGVPPDSDQYDDLARSIWNRTLEMWKWDSKQLDISFKEMLSEHVYKEMSALTTAPPTHNLRG